MKCYSYDNADKRRRDRRQALTDEYNQKHGIVAKEREQAPIPLIHRRRSRVESILSPLDFSYLLQIEQAAEFHAEREEKRRRRAYHNPPKTEFGITAHAKETQQAVI